ncbi:MAG: class II fructose-bisphosphate aldolase [Candidatus Shikimatogenerans bostrichidophilus]|nr:MAG: class II fructose-bisphosphate aldolase [Candidatus Shikimatogenerans bostrichidophilus]
MNKKFPYGVLTGDLVYKLFKYAKKNKFAIPAVNVHGSNTINAAIETAAKMNSPIIIQFSYGGSLFNAGKSNENKSAILGAISGAYHVHLLSKYYKATVILHTDHCNKNLLPWIDGLLKENEKSYKYYGKPLFSSHMLDLSNEPIKKNINICKYYLKKMKKMNITLELELGITGGEEDNINNKKINISKLYTCPTDVEYAYKKLKKISNNFIIAASFGNMHGIHNPNVVKLKTNILKKTQLYIKNKYKTNNKPICFVFHGGSGSSIKDIKKSIEYGVVKMNIDTDTQYAFTTGIYKYIQKTNKYLLSQMNNNKSNKKYYDPRIVLRYGEKKFKKRLIKAFKDLNNVNTL